jgi:hypothetical protein
VPENIATYPGFSPICRSERKSKNPYLSANIDNPRGVLTRNFPHPITVYPGREERGLAMFTFLLWCLLFVVCWPLALLALIAYPFVWLVLLPFRIVGIAVKGVLEVVYLAITLPVRLLAAPFRI